METRAHIIVRGMVQGVGFRYFVYREALECGLRGFARNLENGDVEIEVEGNRSLIEEFIKVVKTGPRAARVTDIIIQWKPPENRFVGFTLH